MAGLVFQMNNSTRNGLTSGEHWIRVINIHINMICIPILTINVMCLLTLPTIWSCYLIYQLINDHRNLKNAKKSQNSMDEQNYKVMLKNAQIKRVKMTFFLFICLTEWIFLISLLILSQENRRVNSTPGKKHTIKMELDYTSTHPSQILFQLRTILDSMPVRISQFIILSSFFTILTLVRILTEYICSLYEYFDIKPYICVKLMLSFCCLSIIGFIGLFRQLLILSNIAMTFAIIYQLIRLFIAVRKLKRLLNKRLFDAQHHECRAPHVINYFGRSLWNYKYGSLILLISLTLETLAIVIEIIHPIIVLILCMPHSWLDAMLHGELTNIASMPVLVYDQIIT